MFHQYVHNACTHDELPSSLPQELKEKDENFVRTLSRASDGDIEELIKRHLVEVETLRKQRNAEGERLNDKLRDKLRQKRAKHGENYIVRHHRPISLEPV